MPFYGIVHAACRQQAARPPLRNGYPRRLMGDAQQYAWANPQLGPISTNQRLELTRYIRELSRL